MYCTVWASMAFDDKTLLGFSLKHLSLNSAENQPSSIILGLHVPWPAEFMFRFTGRCVIDRNTIISSIQFTICDLLSKKARSVPLILHEVLYFYSSLQTDSAHDMPYHLVPRPVYARYNNTTSPFCTSSIHRSPVTKT